MDEPRLRILFASPVWAPSRAFGGPVVAAGELVRRLVERGNEVDVVTTTIVDLGSRPALRSSSGIVDGATVRYLSTPLRYRWMGITPTLPVALARLKRPDVVHVFGFRDPVTTGVAAWCRVACVPYVFEPLGMFEPRLRKVALKRALDATLYRGVARGAAAVVVASEREAGAVDRSGRPGRKGARARQRLSRAFRFGCEQRLALAPRPSTRGEGDPVRRENRRGERDRAPARRDARATGSTPRDRRAGRPPRHLGARPPSQAGRSRPRDASTRCRSRRSHRTTSIRRLTSSSSPLPARASGSSRPRRPRRGRR